MKIGGEYVFDGPRDLVWSMLLDPDVLARVLPGAETLVQVAPNEFDGALRMKVGPVQGEFQGKVRLEDIDPPNGYTMIVDGRGSPGFIKATGHLQLHGEGETTRLVYGGDAQVGGTLAAVGQRLVESSARAIIAQSLEGLNAAVRARVAARAAGPDADGRALTTEPEVPAQTQAQFAAGVARQVVRDAITPRMRLAIIVALVVLLGLVLFRLLY